MQQSAWRLSTSSTLAALAAAGIGVDFVADRGGEVVRIWADARVAELFGSTPPALLGRPANEGLPPEAACAVSELLAAGAGQAARVFDVTLTVDEDAEVRVRLALRRAELEGEPVVVRCFSRTLGPHALERALQQSDRRFRELLDAAPDAVVLVQDGLVAYANAAALAIGGHRSLDELMGTPIVERVHPDDLDKVRRRVDAAIRLQQQNPPTELRFTRPDGSSVPVELVSIPTEWEGRPALLAIGRELTRRREAWAESIQADRLSAVGTLAAGVAHEINNPLAYVLLNLQYIVRELPRIARHPERLEQLHARLAEARHGAGRVRSIVRDLKEFSLPLQTEVAPVDLVRVIEAALKVAASHVEDRAVVVREYASTPMVRGDAARLEQVFLNLVTNAVQAMPAGRRGPNELRVRVQPSGSDRVVAEVIDNGVGIAADLIDRVFDPFFTTKPIGVGTGLGLPICYNIIAALGGTIGVESQPGRGSAFRVELPAFPPGAMDEVPTPPPPSTRLEVRARVLVIDDEQPVAEILRRLLADDFDVEVATSAPQALELLLGSADFDVLLCDLLMPGMSGVDLYREIAALRPGVEQRVIFMTGGAFTLRSAEFLASVPNERLEKPLDLVALRRAVRRAAERPR